MIHQLKYPSLYIRHLQKSQKDMPIPIIIIHEMDSDGYYIEPQNDVVWDIDEVSFPIDRGLIALNSNLTDEEDTITHEWRHHFQAAQLGWNLSSPLLITNLYENLEYEDAIIEYFSQQHEWDALHFTYNKLNKKISIDSCYFLDILYK